MSTKLCVTRIMFQLFSRSCVAYGILGGYNVTIETIPYQINYGDICGGVLIHRQWALTSAHCGKEANFIRISSNRRLKGIKIKILSHFIHPSYGNEHEFDYDVQLLRYRKLHFSKKVSAIDISESGYATYITTSGWGYGMEKGEYNDVLQEVEMKIVPFDKCQSVKKYWYNHTLTDRMFCAGGFGKDACQGDSGGAAVSESGLLGISSFGYGCGRNIPGVYINITEYNIRSWIHLYTGI